LEQAAIPGFHPGILTKNQRKTRKTMAIDFAKYGVGSLNRDAVMDSRKRDQFWPRDVSGQHRDTVLGLRFEPPSKDNRNRASFKAKVRVKESSARQMVGREYTIYFLANGNPEYQHITDNTLAQFCAACLGQNSEDPEFDCDAARQECIDMTDAGDFDSGECEIYHTSVSKSKDGFNKKTGKPETFTNCNHYFNPILEE
jgi:hypothetical protein